MSETKRASQLSSMFNPPSVAELKQATSDFDFPQEIPEFPVESQPETDEMDASFVKKKPAPASNVYIDDEQHHQEHTADDAGDAPNKDDHDAHGAQADEMLDFDNVFDAFLEDMLRGGKKQNRMAFSAFRFFVAIVIGAVVGIAGFVVEQSIHHLMESGMLEVVLDLFAEKQNPAGAFFYGLFICCLFAFVAACIVVFINPQSRASGMGRINVYLSGVQQPKILTFKTLICKCVSLILTISSLLRVGMEGPFIHIGAACAAQVSRAFRFMVYCGQTAGRYGQLVSSVRYERGFIASGIAAGFAVAFNAPIAGVLFAQEGGSAYWLSELTVQTFACAMMAVFVLNILLLPSQHRIDALPKRGLIFFEDQGSDLVVHMSEIFLFAIVGVLGGLGGAFFTKVNTIVSKWRHHHSKSAKSQLLDVLAMTAITFILHFSLPYAFPCRSADVPLCIKDPYRCRQFMCEEGEYSPLANLFFSVPEQTIKSLLEANVHVDYGELVVFTLVMLLTITLYYGIAVPGGIFVGAIMVGASFGRFVGLIAQEIYPEHNVVLGAYAVMGACAQLAGVTRMTMPITVMMMELTGNAQYLLPIMFCVLIAKHVADLFVGSIYSEHLALEGTTVAFGDVMPENLVGLRVRDIMSKPPLQSFCEVEKVSLIAKTMQGTSHNAFPVVLYSPPAKDAQGNFIKEKQKDSERPLLGLISRRTLMFVLQSIRTYSTAEEAYATQIHGQKNQLTAEMILPGKRQLDLDKTIRHVTVDNSIMNHYVDLSEFVDKGAYIVTEDTHARRPWSMFRSLGMRHIVVVNEHHVPVGMLTRQDFIRAIKEHPLRP